MCRSAARISWLFALSICVVGALPAPAVAAPPAVVTEAAVVGVDCGKATLKGTVNPEGLATTYYFEYGPTTSYGAKVPITAESAGSGTSNVPVSQTVTGLTRGIAYHFRVVAESEGGQAKGEDANFATAIDCFDFAFSEEGSGNGQLEQPFGIAIDSEGNIWVADTENNRIEKFNEAGEYLSQFGSLGSENGQFKAPRGIAIDSSDNIWVVDSGNNRVQKFTSKGEYLGKVGEKGSGTGQFESPSGIALDSSDRPFIVDTGNNRVQKFNGSFKFLAEFGEGGSGNGQLNSPTGILIDAGGRIWVSDTGNDRVQRFNPSTFNYISQFGEKGTGNGQFDDPMSIVNDFQGRLWVVDSGNSRMQKFDIEGSYLDQFGQEGEGSGEFASPTDIVAPAATELVIADAGNDRVQGWTVKAEPPTATTNPASEITANSAALNARINPEGLATVYYFEYGLTAAYGSKVPLSPESIGSGTSNVLVEQPIAELAGSTTYHFRVVAESEAGTSHGKDRTFKTL